MPSQIDYSLIVAGSGFIAMMSLVILVFMFVGREKDPVDKRIKSLGSGNSPHHAAKTIRRQKRTPHDEDEDSSQVLTERVIQAGLYKRGSIAIYTTIKFGMMVLPIVMGIVVGQIGLVSPVLGIVYGIIAGVVGTVAPSFWLDYRKSKRQTDIRRALPDALDVIVTCVDAGLSLPAAISRVSRELRTAHPMLAIEMSICQREIQLGASTGTALRRFSQRFDLAELRSLASVIQQAEKYGASITNALRVHSEGLREKRFQYAEEQAQKAAVKIIFPTILCIFPALFIVLAGPAVTRIFTMFETMGQ